MALSPSGALWATTGGGPLLNLDPATGRILGQFGDGLTQTLAIDPNDGRIYVSSGGGVEIFNPVTQTFRHYSNIRVDSLAFAPDGSLWGTTWPDRGDVVRFDNQQLGRGRAERMLSFDDDVDSLAFGVAGSSLDGLLFVSHNDGPHHHGRSQLTMVDLATLQQVAVATGGSRGDNIVTTRDGRVLLSQSHQ